MKSENDQFRADGFAGQVVHFSSPTLQEEVRKHPLGTGLHAIHLGWFPRAGHHLIRRPAGLPESILIFCCKGRGWFELDGVQRGLEAGQALLIPGGKPHAYGAGREEPWSIYWAHFGGNAAIAYHLQLPPGEYALPVSEETSKEVQRIFRRTSAELDGGLTCRSLLLASHALRHILGLLFFEGVRRSLGGKPQFSRDLSGSLQFMRDNLTRSVSLGELAGRAGLSPSRYASLFKEQTGISPVEHHIHLRMQLACQLLDGSTLSIKEIANHLGYEDPYYFSRLFRKVTGYSPLAYRRAEKG